MGQKQSQPSPGSIEKEIEDTQRELLELKAEGLKQQERFYEDLFEVESDLYKMKMRLLKKGEDSKSIWNFWDYAKEVQQTIRTQSTSRPSKSSPSVSTPPSESRALVAPWYFFNIHSLFEAMLLRRLHIAMMLQGQRDAQSRSWNGVIVHMYQMIPQIKQSKKKTEDDFAKTKAEIDKNIENAKESYQTQLNLQRELVHFMILEAKRDNKEEGEEDARQKSMQQSFTSASTQPLPDVVTPTTKSHADGTSPTDDSSDASSLTSSEASTDDDDSDDDEKHEASEKADGSLEHEPLTERV